MQPAVFSKFLSSSLRYLPTCTGLASQISKLRLALKQESVGSGGESFEEQQDLVSVVMVLATTVSVPDCRRQRLWNEMCLRHEEAGV